MARELGGGRFAQVLAALAVIAAPAYLGTDSLLTMDAFDQLWWVMAAYIVVRLLKADDPKLWLLFGLIAGVGLMTKLTMLFFVSALVIGLLLTSGRRYLAGKWLWLGLLIAFVCVLPYIGWEFANGWPTLEFWKAYAGGKTYPVTPLKFVLQQIAVVHPLLLPLWLAGLGYYLFSKEAKPHRSLGIAYVLLFVAFMFTRAKVYFLAPAYPMLFAAGALVVERFSNRPGWRWLKSACISVVTIGGILTAPLVLPVLPVETYIRLFGGRAKLQTERLQMGQLPQYFADRFGWRNLTATVAHVYRSLPPDDQARACIFAGNYGETGAINFFGKAYGLPQAISGHNQYYLWGPGDCTGELVITVGVPLQDVEGEFDSVTVADTATCKYCMPYESMLPILICRGLKGSLQQLWPSITMLDCC
jgi:hypothetical protein